MAEPLIKGVFVSSHVKALEAAKGPEGLAQLEKLYGKPLNFSSLQDVPVRDEVRLIECTLAIMHPEIPEAERGKQEYLERENWLTEDKLPRWAVGENWGCSYNLFRELIAIAKVT